MRASHQLLTYAPIVGVWLQVLLAVVLLTKRAWQKYPVFVAYSFASLFASLGFFALQLLAASTYTVFYFYWGCEALTVLLGFGVVYEIFKLLLEPHAVLRRLAVVSFQCVLVVLIVLAAVTVYTRATGGKNPLVASVLVLEQGTRVIEVGLLMFLFIFSSAFGLHWRQQVFGIAVGLGVFTCTELAGVSIFTHFGPLALAAFSVARVLSFNMSLLIWIGYTLAPERLTTAVDLPKRAQLEQWNQAIMELIHQ
jgi:hypothetical protein